MQIWFLFLDDVESYNLRLHQKQLKYVVVCKKSEGIRGGLMLYQYINLCIKATLWAIELKKFLKEFNLYPLLYSFQDMTSRSYFLH